jgi:hypothetical protein
VRVRLWHGLAFLLLLAVFAVATAPAALLAPARADGFSYARASGSIWEARFEEARFGGASLGTAAWRAAPEALLSGQARGHVRLTGGAISGDGVVSLGLDGGLRLEAPTLAWRPMGLVPGAAESGAATAQGVDIVFQGGACQRAAGEVQADIAAGAPAAIGLAAPQLFGRFVCDGPAAQLRLTGEQDGMQVEAIVRLLADGVGDWTLSIAPEPPAALAMGLPRAGAFRWRPQ